MSGERFTANRVLLAGGVGFATLCLLLGLMWLVESENPNLLGPLEAKLVLALVPIAVFFSDALYVKRGKRDA